MTAGAPARQDVGQIYLVLVQGCLQTAEILSCLSFPASAWRQINTLSQIKKRDVMRARRPPPVGGGTWSLPGAAAPGSADLWMSPEVRQAAGAGSAGVGSLWFL